MGLEDALDRAKAVVMGCVELGAVGAFMCALFLWADLLQNV